MDKYSPAQDYSKAAVIIAGIETGPESLRKSCKWRGNLQSERPAEVASLWGVKLHAKYL